MPNSNASAISIHALHEESDPKDRRHPLITVISIHALHEESDLQIKGLSAGPLTFQSTLSMRRATGNQDRYPHSMPFQSTRSMRRATLFGILSHPSSNSFQSTLSMRRATANQLFVRQMDTISIHALHEESDQFNITTHKLRGISIHALHEESDESDENTTPQPTISIHALHEESDDLV